MKPKNTHGGSRPNAGRKPSKEKTLIISFRVPELKAKHIKEKLSEILKTL